MKKFFVKDVPDSTTVFNYLKANTNWWETKEKCKPKREYPSIIEFEIDGFSATKAQEAIESGYQKYGSYGWLTKDGPMDEYYGVSLAYNPNHQESLDPHRSTLGTGKNAVNQFFYGRSENHALLKNSYFDTYSFNHPTPFIQDGHLGELLAKFKRTLIRSRCSTIDPMKTKDHTSMITRKHKDEEIFENLRINIPVTSYPTYFFEIEGTPRKHLQVGKAYTFDSFVPHGVFSTEIVPVTRTNLVFGFSPWFDYLPEEDAWVQNEFWGKHPFDMVYDGDIVSGVKF